MVPASIPSRPPVHGGGPAQVVAGRRSRPLRKAGGDAQARPQERSRSRRQRRARPASRASPPDDGLEESKRQQRSRPRATPAPGLRAVRQGGGGRSWQGQRWCGRLSSVLVLTLSRNSDAPCWIWLAPRQAVRRRFRRASILPTADGFADPSGWSPRTARLARPLQLLARVLAAFSTSLYTLRGE